MVKPFQDLQFRNEERDLGHQTGRDNGTRNTTGILAVCPVNNLQGEEGITDPE